MFSSLSEISSKGRGFKLESLSALLRSLVHFPVGRGGGQTAWPLTHSGEIPRLHHRLQPANPGGRGAWLGWFKLLHSRAISLVCPGLDTQDHYTRLLFLSGSNHSTRLQQRKLWEASPHSELLRSLRNLLSSKPFVVSLACKPECRECIFTYLCKLPWDALSGEEQISMLKINFKIQKEKEKKQGHLKVLNVAWSVPFAML